MQDRPSYSSAHAKIKYDRCVVSTFKSSKRAETEEQGLSSHLIYNKRTDKRCNDALIQLQHQKERDPSTAEFDGAL